jgi:valyl-tRNA synthetase
MKLSKVYEPNQYEEDIYALWEKAGAFKAKDRGTGKSYSIVMPPPNANANLHIGYGLTGALEDILARYHRMKGESTLLLPGADHAGFETQVVYEKQLAKEGKSRFDFTREQLYKQLWDFVAGNRLNFEAQFRRLGISCDWSRYTFTLDDKIIKLAYKTFKKMWDEGLIYRGERLVNFCTFHGTAFADIEVEYKEETGHLWYIRYPITDGGGEVVIATTRPETMLGDTAVMVHPKDPRYKRFIGKTVKLPLTKREIPVIADEYVDKEFGTGAVKVTPSHDPNDYDVAQRHDLPMITVIDHEGKLNHEVPENYRGLEVKQAREQIVADLKEQGLLVKTEGHKHSVGHCYKCGTIIQPLLREQWFVDMKPLAEQAIAALKAGKIIFYPEPKKDQLIKYLEGLRDWNISRQIAWGIPIPAFQNVEDPDDWIYDERVGDEEIVVGTKRYRRDPDVFDTWFSSSSWPYATLDFPDGEDFKQFYPLSVMETGGEILYPWVSRMIMMGLYVTGKVPFEAVYIHGYVMAEDGAKMSKSIGNVIDPIEVINKYGSDALRMGIIAGRAPAVNRGYDHRRVEEARNFANKLWNIARFIEDKIGDDFKARNSPSPQTPADHWILYKLQHLTEAISADLDNYRFAESYERLYHLVWDDFADWYVEASKTQPNNSVLAFGLETILKLAHPFAPFVTETIWQTLKWEADTILATSKWPEVPEPNMTKAREFEAIQSLVSEIRSYNTQLKKPAKKLFFTDKQHEDEYALVIKLAKLDSVTHVTEGQGLRLNSRHFDAWLDIDNKAIEGLKESVAKQIKEKSLELENLEKRLNNRAYADNAPLKIVNQTKAALDTVSAELSQLKNERDRLAA